MLRKGDLRPGKRGWPPHAPAAGQREQEATPVCQPPVHRPEKQDVQLSEYPALLDAQGVALGLDVRQFGEDGLKLEIAGIGGRRAGGRPRAGRALPR